MSQALYFIFYISDLYFRFTFQVLILDLDVWFLVSGLTFMSPEAGGTLRRELGEPKWAATSHSPLRHCIRTL